MGPARLERNGDLRRGAVPEDGALHAHRRVGEKGEVFFNEAHPTGQHGEANMEFNFMQALFITSRRAACCREGGGLFFESLFNYVPP